MSEYIMKETPIDRIEEGWYSKYKGNSIGRAMHYIYCICGLHQSENIIFDNPITFFGRPFASIDWSKGYPHFTFVDEYYNKKQEDLLSKDLIEGGGGI
jgi:hypothetical protein